MEVLVGYIDGRRFIWSESNPCALCSREMYRKGFEEDGKVIYHAKGLCSACYQSNRGYQPASKIEELVGYRACIRCLNTLPDTEFSINQSTSSGKSPWCKKCTTLNKFKMTKNDYELMVEEQDGLCLICEKDPTLKGKVLVVDHDRSCCPTSSSCGECIRGLLCTTCNSGLGFFLDQQQLLSNAINYLKERNGESFRRKPDQPEREAQPVE